MKLKLTSAALVALSILPLHIVAEEATVEEAVKEKPVFSGSAQLGILFKTGNTESNDLKSGFKLRYEKGDWLSLADFDILVKQADITDANGETTSETTDQKWTVNSKTNYILNHDDISYLYGNIWFEDDRFSGFENQSSVSVGWGKEWYKTDKSRFFADFGPGIKRDDYKPTDTKEGYTETDFIIQAQAYYLREINEHVEFKQTVSLKQATESDANSVYSAETTITTKLISTLQLQFAFKADHNTEVEAGTERTDTQTSVTLVYSF